MEKYTFHSKRKLTSLGLSLFVIVSLSLTLYLVHHQQEIRQQAAVAANTTVDFTSPIQTLSPFAIAMAETGYQTPDVLASDVLEQQRVRDLKLGFIRMH